MKSSIFRKESLNRISSPEELDNYIKVTNGGIWVLLLGLCIVMVGVILWAFLGSIPETVLYKGISHISDDGETKVYLFVPMSQGRRITEGMQVQVSPDYAPREEYGYAYGVVSYVGTDPVIVEDLIDVFGSLQLLSGIFPQGNPVEIRVSLIKDQGRYTWSNSLGQAVTISKGAYCDVLILVNERRPYELIFK